MCVRHIWEMKANFSIDYAHAPIVKILFISTGYDTLSETVLLIFITLAPSKEVVNANIFRATGRLERDTTSPCAV